MGYLIGAPSASGWSLSTWGKLRTAAGQFQIDNISPNYINVTFRDLPPEDFNQSWTVNTGIGGNYFKSAATGSGWLKGGFNLLTSPGVPDIGNFLLPYIFLSTDPFPATGTDVGIVGFDHDTYVGELTGETVVFQPAPPNDSFVITAAMETGSVNVPGFCGYPLISIGKLVQIS
jgi:hypothetical protein